MICLWYIADFFSLQLNRARVFLQFLQFLTSYGNCRVLHHPDPVKVQGHSSLSQHLRAPNQARQSFDNGQNDAKLVGRSDNCSGMLHLRCVKSGVIQECLFIFAILLGPVSRNLCFVSVPLFCIWKGTTCCRGSPNKK